MYRLAACSVQPVSQWEAETGKTTPPTPVVPGCWRLLSHGSELPSHETEWNLLLYALSKCHLCYCHWCSNTNDINAMLSRVSSKTQSFSQHWLNKGLEAFKGSSAFDGWITSDTFWSNLSETFTVAARYLSIYRFIYFIHANIVWLFHYLGCWVVADESFFGYRNLNVFD